MPLTLTDAQRARLDATQDVWLASVKPDAAAHLVPVWAVRVGDHLYIGTEPKTQKVRNILAHPRVAIALPDARHVLIVEGRAALLDGPAPDGVVAAFQSKYDWTLDPTAGTYRLLEFIPDKVLSWNSDES